MVRYALWGGVGACALLAIVSFVKWRVDQSEIRDHVGDAVKAEATDSEKMRQALRYMESEVGYKLTDDYFLLPVFRFMKPTARQVIEGPGGDCAYRARAYIVVLGQQDVEASKLAVYNDAGQPVHAVVKVETEKGPYVVDLLYNVIHEDRNGDPIPLHALVDDPKALEGSLKLAAKNGNKAAKKYPLDQYAYHEVRTLNWDKSAPMKAAFGVVSAVVGEEEARNMPRPYLSEEPALMVIAASGAGAAGCLVLLGIGAWRRRRKAKKAAA